MKSQLVSFENLHYVKKKPNNMLDLNLNMDTDEDNSSSSSTFNFLDNPSSFHTIQLFSLSHQQPHAPPRAFSKQWLALSSSPRFYHAPPPLPEQTIAPPLPLPVKVKKSRRGPRSRSSQYRGVTFYRRTGRWESHIWDNGKQVYLGGFDTAHSAARAYDRAAVKFRGTEADINFNVADYDEDIAQMSHFTKEEFVQMLRRQSIGFARGSSKYRGVTLHKCGRWEARIGQLLGKNAYDEAAIKCHGSEVVTNFSPCSYDGKMEAEANNAGMDDCLDLKLGIAPRLTSECPNENISLSSLRIPPGINDMPIPISAMNANFGSPSAELPLMSNMNSNFLPIHMERATEKSMDANSFSNLEWPMQGYNDGATPMPLFSAAASSGFSSSSTPPSSTVVAPLHFPTTSFLQRHLPPSFSNSTFHFYCRS